MSTNKPTISISCREKYSRLVYWPVKLVVDEKDRTSSFEQLSKEEAEKYPDQVDAWGIYGKLVEGDPLFEHIADVSSEEDAKLIIATNGLDNLNDVLEMSGVVSNDLFVEMQKNHIKFVEKLVAQLDALMLEYCPDEMTPEQIEEWGKNQKPVEEDDWSNCQPIHQGV